MSNNTDEERPGMEFDVNEIINPRNYSDRRYPDDISGYSYGEKDSGYCTITSSRTDSDYHRRYSPASFQNVNAYIEMLDPLERRRFIFEFRQNYPMDYAFWYANYKVNVKLQKLISRKKECRKPVLSQDYSPRIDMLDPSERKSFIFKFRKNNPKEYAVWYENYKAQVELQKLMLRNKDGPEYSTPISTQSHDMISLSHTARPPPMVNPYWQPRVISQPTEQPPQNGKIIDHSNRNEMKLEIPTITPDIAFTDELEEVISTEPISGLFDRQMAGLEPKYFGMGDKCQKKENNSWFGRLIQPIRKIFNNIGTYCIGNFGNKDAIHQAAPPMDSEFRFNPVENSYPATQSHNRFRIQRKRRVKDMYVNIMSNSLSTKNVLAPDPIF